MAAPIRYTPHLCPQMSIDKKDGGLVLYKDMVTVAYKLIGDLKKQMNTDYLLKSNIVDATKRLTEIHFIGCTASQYKKYREDYVNLSKNLAKNSVGGRQKVVKKKSNIKKIKAKK